MSIKEIDDEYVANTYKRFNVVFVGGQGATLLDENGKKYIDFASGIATNSLGVGESSWKQAVIGQINKIQHTSNLYYNEPCGKLAKLLCDKTGLKKVFFANSGAEANECAIKTARKYSFDKYGENRYEIITLKNSFHGRTIATLSATGQDVFHQYFNPFVDGFKFAEANNFESVLSLISEKTCEIMLELIQGEGGVNVLNRDFVDKIYNICNKKDILLIIDEVQTGNGRCGSLYAYEQYNILPDIVTTAKGLGGGLPIGACMIGEKAKNTLNYGSHGSTFGANPVVCAGATAVLNSLTTEFLNQVKIKGEKIKRVLLKCKQVKSVSGLGLMLGIECDNAKKKVEQLLEKGLIVLTAKNKIRLLPPLNISESELNAGLKILEEILN